MAELRELTTFPATIEKVQQLQNMAIRVTLDLPETAIKEAGDLMNLRDRYLQMIVYDADEFQKAINRRS